MCLILGLAAGLLLPRLATLMQPYLPQMVAVLLMLTALRIGHRAAMGSARDLRIGIAAVLVLQLAVPLTTFACLWAAGLHGTAAGLATILVTSAPAISGSANLALMLGLDAGRMMQILVLGTAAFPLTVLPILALLPQLGEAWLLMRTALVLLVVIIGAAAIGFGLRAALFKDPSPQQIKTLDGASVLAFAVIVIALMAPLNAALLSRPETVALWALLAFAISYGLQIAALLILRGKPLAGPLALGVGNRNVALFLVALPADVIAPLMIFVACWQLPMYLTPLLLPRLYAGTLHD